MNTVQPHKDRIYRPTFGQWQKITTETEIDPICSYSKIELINFNTSRIHFKGGLRIPFDCLSEAEYVHVCNGGYYEDAPDINDEERI